MKPHTVETLRQAGWTPDRRIDLSVIQAAYAAEGLPLYKRTKEFLSRFGDLLIPYENLWIYRAGNPSYLSFFAGDEVIGWGWIMPSHEIKSNPIGNCWHDSGIHMDRYGRVWLLGIASPPCLFASNGEEMIDLIINWSPDNNAWYHKVGWMG